MFSMSTATWSPSHADDAVARSTPPGSASSAGVAGGAADRGRDGPARPPRCRGPTASASNARGSVGLNVRLIEHLAPAATMMPRKQVPPVILKLRRRGLDDRRLECRRPGVEHGGVQLGALEPEQHRAEVERRERQLRRRLDRHDRPAAVASGHARRPGWPPPPSCRRRSPGRSWTAPGCRARPAPRWCRRRRARGGCCRARTRRRADRRRDRRRRRRACSEAGWSRR